MSFLTRIICPVSRATSVPAPMAMPMSAWASAGASFIPSPTIATTCPFFWNLRISSAFLSGITLASTLSMPTRVAIACAVLSLSPVRR